MVGERRVVDARRGGDDAPAEQVVDLAAGEVGGERLPADEALEPAAEAGPSDAEVEVAGDHERLLVAQRAHEVAQLHEVPARDERQVRRHHRHRPVRPDDAGGDGDARLVADDDDAARVPDHQRYAVGRRGRGTTRQSTTGRRESSAIP